MSPSLESITIKKVAASEISQLLLDNELPIKDLAPEHSVFFGAFKDAKLVGCIGLETLGSLGLLRSLAVQKSIRRLGLGIVLTETVLKEANDKLLTEVYLLTTDAEEFFYKTGFNKIVKEEAPEPIKKTKQYSEICSDSAVVMKIDLT